FDAELAQHGAEPGRLGLAGDARPSAFVPAQHQFLVLHLGGQVDPSGVVAESAVLGGVRCEFVDQQGQRRSASIVNADVFSGNDNFAGFVGGVGREDLLDQRVERHRAFHLSRLIAVWAHEFMCAGQSGNALADLGGERLMIGSLTGGQADQAADSGAKVLDARAQLTAEDLDLFAVALGIVDVGAGTYPADDLAVAIVHRHGPAEHPPVLATAMPEAILDLVRFTGFKTFAPALPGLLAVGGVKDRKSVG